MEIIKTICPRCFKIFNVLSSDGMGKVRCDFCKYMYEVPRFTPKEVAYNYLRRVSSFE